MSHQNTRPIFSEERPSALQLLGEFPLLDLLDGIDVGLVALDMAGNIVHLNSAAAAKFGLANYERWEGSAEQFAEIFDLFGADGARLPFRDWPVARALRGEQLNNVEYRIRRVGGDWSGYHRYSSSTMHDGDGEPRLVLMTIKDISDRGELEEQLHLRVEELEGVMEVAPVALFVSTDPRCEKVTGNRLANTLYNAGPGENLSARNSQDRRFYSEARELSVEELPMQMAAARNATVRNMELEVRVGDRRFDILSAATPLHTPDGEVRGCVGAFLDITERKQSEAKLASALELAEQRRQEAQICSSELESFNYSVSHDLQAPLRAINGFARALLEDCASSVDDDCRFYLDRIQQGSQRMSALIDGLLRLSHLSGAQLDREQVDLSALAHEVVSELSAASPERSVAVEITGGLTANGDFATLRLLVQNLVGNAWKFTAHQAAGKIRFSCIRRNGEDVFVVEDNGTGFDMEHAHRLFQPFERLHTDEAFQGTGIGLATVKRVAARHGGNVWAESMPGQGASFFFTLPEPERTVAETAVG